MTTNPFVEVRRVLAAWIDAEQVMAGDQVPVELLAEQSGFTPAVVVSSLQDLCMGGTSMGDARLVVVAGDDVHAFKLQTSRWIAVHVRIRDYLVSQIASGDLQADDAISANEIGAQLDLPIHIVEVVLGRLCNRALALADTGLVVIGGGKGRSFGVGPRGAKPLRPETTRVRRYLTREISARRLGKGSAISLESLALDLHTTRDAVYKHVVILRDSKSRLGASGLVVTDGDGRRFRLGRPRAIRSRRAHVLKSLNRSVRLLPRDAIDDVRIASSLRVSRSWVRAALAQARDNGTPLGNTGLVVLGGGRNRAFGVGEPGATPFGISATKVRRYLRTQINAGRLQPGTELNRAEIAARLDLAEGTVYKVLQLLRDGGVSLDDADLFVAGRKGGAYTIVRRCAASAASQRPARGTS